MNKLCPNKNTLPKRKSGSLTTRRLKDTTNVTGKRYAAIERTDIKPPRGPCAKDLRGLKFGNLKVLHRNGTSSFRQPLWKCQCNCGETPTIIGQSLKNGRSTSCGCVKSPNLIGEKFNRLLVVGVSRRSHSKKTWECLCDCGRVTFLSTYLLTSGTTKSCGCLVKELMSKRKGRFHPNWRHDLSLLDRDENNHRNLLPRNRAWMKRVFTRDNYTCQLSNERGGELSAHHLSAWARSKTLRFRTSNGVTLKRILHKLFHSIYGSGQNTPAQFLEFASRYRSGEFTKILTTAEKVVL